MQVSAKAPRSKPEQQEKSDEERDHGCIEWGKYRNNRPIHVGPLMYRFTLVKIGGPKQWTPGCRLLFRLGQSLIW